MVEPAIFTIPTGIDLAPFADGVREKQLRTPVADEAPMLITVGRLAKEKNIEEILELLADARDSSTGISWWGTALTGKCWKQRCRRWG